MKDIIKIITSGDDKRKHLELIQVVISRMGGNLFYLRGWSITLIGVVLALLSQVNNQLPLLIIMGVIVVFWLYDGYFLGLERSYRNLYDKVRKLDEKEIDFSMDIREFNNNKKNTLIYCMFSKTLAPFYVLSLAAAFCLIIRIL